MTLADIASDFALLDDWEDRYRYVIELGRALAPLAPEERSEATRVRGCASQVWLITSVERQNGAAPMRMHFRGESDAHIVRGLIAILLALYDGKSPDEVLAVDAYAALRDLGLAEHLTPQRSNGLKSMIERIRNDAEQARCLS